MPFSVERKILNRKLGSDEKGVPYYLYLLNLDFGENELEKEINLNKFRQLAVDLKNKPRIIKKLILNPNWRPNLVGNAVAIFLRAKEFEKDLIWRLVNGSWVAPQIAVGIALLDNGMTQDNLRKIIESASEDSHPKTIMSAYSSLKFLQNKFADDFEKTDLFRILKEKDSWDNSISIAEAHWSFWNKIKLIK